MKNLILISATLTVLCLSLVAAPFELLNPHKDNATITQAEVRGVSANDASIQLQWLTADGVAMGSVVTIDASFDAIPPVDTITDLLAVWDAENAEIDLSWTANNETATAVVDLDTIKAEVDEYFKRISAGPSVLGGVDPTEYNLSKFEFLLLLTVHERVAIRGAMKTDPIIEDFMEMMSIVGGVKLSNSVTVQGLQYMYSQGLLSGDRLGEILTGADVEKVVSTMH